VCEREERKRLCACACACGPDRTRRSFGLHKEVACLGDPSLDLDLEVEAETHHRNAASPRAEGD
jgi:hypothetical protein